MTISKENIKSKKRLKLTFSIIIVIILALALMPVGIKYGIEDALIKMGVDKAEIEDVDLNPFTGDLAIHNIRTDRSGDTELDIEKISVSFSWTSLIRKRIYINKVNILNAFVNIERLKNGQLMIGGLSFDESQNKVEKEKDTAPFGFGIDEVSISDSKAVFSDSEFKLTLDIERALLSGLYTWKAENLSHISLRTNVNKSPVSIDAGIKAFAPVPSIQANVTADSILLKPFACFLPPDIKVDDGRLSLNSEVDIELLSGGNIRVEHKGSVSINRTDITQQNINVQNNSLKWAGRGTFTRKDNTDKIELNGRLMMEDLTVNDRNKNLGLVKLGSIELDNIDMAGIEMISLDNIFLKKIRLLTRIEQDKADIDRLNSILNSDALTISGILLKDLKDLDLEHIELSGISALVRIKKDGELFLFDELLSSAEQPEAEEKKEPSQFSIKMKSFQLSGKNSVIFEDKNITPNFRTILLIKKASISDIDSSRADSTSPYVLDAGIGEFTSINLSGNISPFSEKPSFDVSGTINEFNLSMLSPYTARHLGYKLKSGQINADTGTKVNKGIIDCKNKLVINKLEVEPGNEDRINKMTTMLTMPLDSALSLLRDKNNVIQLNLPVSGDINDPKFEIGDIINTAMGAAMKKAAMTYVKYIFQPYGALISLVDMGSNVTKLKLDPIHFQPGSAEPDSNALKYIENVARILNDRPDIKLSLCGKTTTDDLKSMTLQKIAEDLKSEVPVQPELIAIPEEEILALARQRTVMIKKILFKDHGIETKRLFICDPELDLSEKGKPRVDLLI